MQKATYATRVGWARRAVAQGDWREAKQVRTSTTCFFPARAFISQPTCRHGTVGSRELGTVLQVPRSQAMLTLVPPVLPTAHNMDLCAATHPCT